MKRCHRGGENRRKEKILPEHHGGAVGGGGEMIRPQGEVLMVGCGLSGGSI